MKGPADILNDPTPTRRWIGLYKATVEARDDPDQMHRIRARVIGVHPDEIPANKIPWAFPRHPSWIAGGLMAVPPLDALVWIEFENGDHRYPVWSGGIWAHEELSPALQKKIIERPRTEAWFGSEKTHPKSSLLCPDRVEPNPVKSPNHFGLTSPLLKRLHLDDRKDRERLALMDQLGNGLWANTEVGSVSLEAITGLQAKEDDRVSLTLWKKEGWQFSSQKGWLVGQHEKQGCFRISSPNGYELTLSESRKSFEVATPAGAKLVLSDAGLIRMISPGNRTVEIDDGRSRILLSDGEGAYLLMTDKLLEVRHPVEVKLKSAGDFTVDCTGDFKVMADGVIRLAPKDVDADVEPADLEFEELASLDVQERFPKAWEWTCYRDPIIAGDTPRPDKD